MSTEREVKLDCSELKELFRQRSWFHAIKLLNDEFRISRNDNGVPIRLKVPEKTIDCLCELYCQPETWLHQPRILPEGHYGDIATELQTTIGPSFWDEYHAIDKDTNVALALLRALRNSVIHPDTQKYLAKKVEFLEHLQKLISKESTYETRRKVLEVALTFLCNFINSSRSNSDLCHELFYSDVKRLIEKSICLYESSAFIYNLYLNSGRVEINLSVCKLILKEYEKADKNEYFYFIVSKFYLPSVDFWRLNSMFDVDDRIIIWKVLKENIEEGIKLSLPGEACAKLKENFQNAGAVIMPTAEGDIAGRGPYEVTLLMDVVAALVASEQHRHQFKGDEDMFVLTHTLLYSIHKTGMSSENYFSAIQRLKDVTEPSEVMVRHPAFGLKVRLVKIIANLCWESKEMQDLARRLGVIPLLLDCCNIDARNPFIMQWIIFALRNLCEGNAQNQAIIAGLHQEGVVSSEELEDFGLTLHSDTEGTIKVVPLELLQKKD